MLALLPPHAADAPKPAKPNILVIFTDDLDFEEVAGLAKYGDAALAGKPRAKAQVPLTPNRRLSERHGHDDQGRPVVVLGSGEASRLVCGASRRLVLPDR